MAAVSAGLCELDGWDWDPDCLDVPEDTPPERIEYFAAVAAEFLWAATGRRLGPSCPIPVRPCLKSCASGSYGFPGITPLGYNGTPWIPYIGADGRYYNASLCGCPAECHCGPELCKVYLPGPVYDIVSVTVDGETIPEDQYAILDNEHLVRLNPDGDPDTCWPGCQDFTKADGDGTFFVTYRTGLRVPLMATMAMTDLIAHFIRGCNGGCGCNATTTRNLQRLSRQGVDLQFQGVASVLGEGRTGIETVDWLIRQWNPYGLASPMRVLSPDAPRRPQHWRTPRAGSDLVTPFGGGR